MSVATPSCGFSHFSALLQNCSLPGAGRSTPNFTKRPPLRNAISGRCLTTVIMALQNISFRTYKLISNTSLPQSPQKRRSEVFPEAAISLCIFGVPSTVMSLVGVGKFTAKLQGFQHGSEYLRFKQLTVNHLMPCNSSSGRVNLLLEGSFEEAKQ